MEWKRDLPEIAGKLGADLVLLDGKVITVDDADSVAEAVAVKYGRIACVGSNRDVKRLIRRGTRVIDLGGHCVTPGFITTHEHFLRYGYNAVSGIDLWYPRVKSIADIVEAVEAKVAETPKGSGCSGSGGTRTSSQTRGPQTGTTWTLSRPITPSTWAASTRWWRPTAWP